MGEQSDGVSKFQPEEELRICKKGADVGAINVKEENSVKVERPDGEPTVVKEEVKEEADATEGEPGSSVPFQAQETPEIKEEKAEASKCHLKKAVRSEDKTSIAEGKEEVQIKEEQSDGVSKVKPEEKLRICERGADVGAMNVKEENSVQVERPDGKPTVVKEEVEEEPDATEGKPGSLVPFQAEETPEIKEEKDKASKCHLKKAVPRKDKTSVAEGKEEVQIKEEQSDGVSKVKLEEELRICERGADVGAMNVKEENSVQVERPDGKPTVVK